MSIFIDIEHWVRPFYETKNIKVEITEKVIRESDLKAWNEGHKVFGKKESS